MIPEKYNPSEITKPAGPRRASTTRAVGCDWIGCKAKAVIVVPKASAHLCIQHYGLNCIRFNCVLEGELIQHAALTQ